MNRAFVLLGALASPLLAEVYTLTMEEAVARALAQNPEIAMSRLDALKADAGVRLARDGFSPKVFAGSGLAYSSGFPLSIEGAVPSVFQARGSQFFFNRQQSYLVAEARENARGALFAAGSKRDEVAFRTASLFLDVDRAGRLNSAAVKQVASLEKVARTVHDRVGEGRELPIEEKRSALELLRARQRVESSASDREYAERSLAVVLGYEAGDRARAMEGDRPAVAIPDTEEAAVALALASNQELKRLESAMLAKGLEVKSQKAARLPRVDLVAEYALLARYNNYDKFFKAFQQNNTQIGLSFQIPVLVGPGIKASVAQAEVDGAHLRLEMQAARNRISLDVHQAFQQIAGSNLAREVSRADLDVARDSLSILLAQMNEGRVSLRQVEEGRFLEEEKWIAFYDAQFAGERARLNLLRLTGELAATLR